MNLMVANSHLYYASTILMLFNFNMSGQKLINKSRFSATEFIYKVNVIHSPKENIKGGSENSMKNESGDINYLGIRFDSINIDGTDLVNTFYYYYDDRYNLLNQSASLSEVTDSSIWLHPPRSGIFNILEFCPFVYVKEGNASLWEWGVIINNEWVNDDFLAASGLYPTPDLKQKYLYTLKGDTNFFFNGNLYECKEIVAKSMLPVFNSEAHFLFSNEIGFPYILFRFSDVYTVTLDLKKIITH